MKKYTRSAGRFDGHGNAMVRYRVHCPMKEVPGLYNKPLDAAIVRVFAPM
jgi:hypothetical protein